MSSIHPVGNDLLNITAFRKKEAGITSMSLFPVPMNEYCHWLLLVVIPKRVLPSSFADASIEAPSKENPQLKG